MNSNFLLNTPLAKELYGEVCRLPIIDYHNHLDLKRTYENIADLWLKSDPYKHRLMRIMGVAEKYITGTATDFEKFSNWCRVFPSLIGTPVYDWCLMELKQVFDCDIFPSENTADTLWIKLNDKMNGLNVLDKFNIEYTAPCASVCDDISFYEKNVTFSPSLRSDDIFMPNTDFIKKLENISGMKINSLDTYFKAISLRLDSFEKAGLKFTDHALDDGFVYYTNHNTAENIFLKLLNGKTTKEEKEILKSKILVRLGCEYKKRGLVMQLHIGALRDTSTRLKALAGKAGGFAAIGSEILISSVTALLDDIEKAAGALPKTILFTLNPAFNAAFSVLSGSYAREGMRAVVSQGPAWWWADHKNGMCEVFESISCYGVFQTFIGMTTDSRSPLSFIRHDYFRRVLCDWTAKKAEDGSFPDNFEILKELVINVCYKNAKECLI